MAGNTATICVQAFRAEWEAGVPMAALCQRWTITKDQLVRLKQVWDLPLRYDRARKRGPRGTVPEEELRASESSLDLAPLVAAAAEIERRAWTLDVEHSRRGSQSGGTLPRLPKIVSMAAINAAMRQTGGDE